MAFWNRKQEPEPPQVEPGLQSKADAIKFSNEPAFGKPIPISEVDFPVEDKQPASGMVSTPKPVPFHVDSPAESSQPETAPQEKVESESKPKSFSLFKSKGVSQEPNDEEVRRNRWVKARRRFVGALMLFLAAAIVLPLVFDEEPPPKTVTIPLRIPSENSVDVAKITVPGTAEQAAKQTQSQPKPEPKPQVAPPPKTTQPADPKADPKTEVKTPDKVTPKADQPKDTKGDNKATGKTDPKKDAGKPKAEDKKPDQQKNTAETSKAPTMAKGSFYIQVIALANEGRAKEIAKKISDSGVNSFLSPIGTKNGKVYRVQCGPFKTKEEANAANAKISMAGMAAGKVLQVK